MTLKIAIHGAAGRMGRALVQMIHDAPDLELAAAIDSPHSPFLGRDAGELAGVSALGWPITGSLEAMASADVVIDFSLPVAFDALLAAVTRYSRPLVLATTGLGDAQWKALDAASKSLPIVAAPNYSLGVTVLYHLAKQASALLPDFDMEVIEMHHRNKVDAPSGTALGLAQAAGDGRQLAFKEHAVYGREGITGARKKDEIGVMTLRGGDVIGDHTLILAGPGERLELTHKSTQRTLFAQGALKAARWLPLQTPGRYTMANVLGLA